LTILGRIALLEAKSNSELEFSCFKNGTIPANKNQEKQI
jgi:hypothetical protein